METPIKVVIVDDHAIVREGLKKMLAVDGRIEVIGEAEDGLSGLEVIGKLKPDVVVLDISMPKMGGIEVIASVADHSPDSRVVILSMHGKESLAQEALRAGAFGYILKGDNGEELIAAICAAARGEYYFSAQLRAALVSSYIGAPVVKLSDDEKKFRSLSEREQQYFWLMLRGESTLEISKSLKISHKTAQKHRTSVVKKLGVSNPVEMIKLAVRLDLIDPTSFKDS